MRLCAGDDIHPLQLPLREGEGPSYLRPPDFMPLPFFSNKTRTLGVDIAATGIKVVELLREKGRFRLATYGYSERAFSETMTPLLDHPKETGALLARVCKEAGVQTRDAVSALPLSHLFSSLLPAPDSVKKQEAEADIRREAAKLLPLPVDQMLLFTTQLSETAASGRATGRVLVTAAAKTLVAKYTEVFAAARLTLRVLDTEAFGLIRALVGKEKTSMLLVDIGHTRTNVIVVEQGVPFLSRTIQLGGDTVTSTLSKALGLSRDQAERLKRDAAIKSAQAPSVDALPPALQTVFQTLFHEMKFCLEMYEKTPLRQNRMVEKIILTGSSAHLPGLAPEIARTFGVNTYVGDPWARVVVPEALRVALDDVGPRLAVAVGLAMRDR